LSAGTGAERCGRERRQGSSFRAGKGCVASPIKSSSAILFAKGIQPMMDFLFFAQGAEEYTLIGGATAIISALTGAVTYLWRRAESEFDECKKDRAKLWEAIAELEKGRSA